MNDVSVITATLPGREDLLARAVASVASQTIEVTHIIERDETGQGPSVTRNAAVGRSGAEWVAFLDDDDQMYPNHVEALLGAALSEGADAAYAGYDRIVFHSRRFGHVSNPDMTDYAHPMPVTFLVRREAFLGVGGFPEEKPEEYHLQERLRAHGVEFAFHPERTWRYNVHGKNTSGLPATAARLYRMKASR